MAHSFCLIPFPHFVCELCTSNKEKTAKHYFSTLEGSKVCLIKNNTGNFPETWRPWLICKSCTYICMNFIWLVASIHDGTWNEWSILHIWINKFSSLIIAHGWIFLIHPFLLFLFIYSVFYFIHFGDAALFLLPFLHFDSM